MKPSKGYYSLIQYCPDLSRLEAANIGVVLFCPEKHFLKARTARANRRIQQVFGRAGHDWSQIDSFKIGIEERIEVENGKIRTLEDLEQFIATRANLIQITPPRPMRVTDPGKDLDELYKELVGGARRKEKTRSFRQFLSEQFAEAGVAKKLKKDIRVVVPLLERELEVPFGFQNGRFNLVQPARFRGSNRVSLEDTACRYAIEGESLYKNPHRSLGELQLIVVGEFGAVQNESKAIVRKILDTHKVRFFPENELDVLIEEIRTTAKDTSGKAG